jgi:hypothetical protein
MFFSKFFVGLTAIAIVGCSTAAQTEHARVFGTLEATALAQQECSKNIEVPLSIKDKFYKGDDAVPPLSFLTNKSTPTKAELKDLQNMYEAGTNCRNIVLQGTQQSHYQTYQAATECYAQKAALYAGFMDGQTSWGDINKQLIANTNACQKNFNNAVANIQGQLDISHQNEVQQRSEAIQRASANMQQQQLMQQQQMMQQQMINNMNRPTNTNCTGFGNRVNCTTY